MEPTLISILLGSFTGIVLALTGAGGAIISNAADSEFSSVTAVNCTFADNLGAIGAGIAR